MHGSVHGRMAWWVCTGGACFIMFGVCVEVPEPVTSLLGGCYMKWILHLGKSRIGDIQELSYWTGGI